MMSFRKSVLQKSTLSSFTFKTSTSNLFLFVLILRPTIIPGAPPTPATHRSHKNSLRKVPRHGTQQSCLAGLSHFGIQGKASVVLLMVQKSGVYQLRLVVYPIIYMVFTDTSWLFGISSKQMVPDYLCCCVVVVVAVFCCGCWLLVLHCESLSLYVKQVCFFLLMSLYVTCFMF